MVNPQPNEPKKSSCVEKSFKFIARYAPATASGGLFLLSLKNAEWVKVIISIPPMILSTIWAAYSKAFLDRLTHWPESDIWKEITRLYAAQLRNPSAFIRRLIEVKTPEATALAYECLQETSRQLDPKVEAELQSISSTVQDARYQKLEELLKHQQFKEADDETYRLMIETVGKEYGQYFDREDLETFPCEDLRIVDQLWFKYSKGRFGFSVQKKIYMDDLGGTKEYDKEIWEEFCDRVGWTKGGSYVSYWELTYELQDTKNGKLPVLRGFAMWVGGFWFGECGVKIRPKG